MYRPIDLCLSLLVIFIFKQLVHLSNTKKQKSWIICHEKINDKLALSDRAVIILETPLKKKSVCNAPFEEPSVCFENWLWA